MANYTVNERSSLLGNRRTNNRSRTPENYSSTTLRIQSDGEAHAEFLRKTTKFWVLPSNILEVKNRVLDKMPEYRFDGKPTTSVANSGSWVNSVYFDSRKFKVYRKRLRQEDMSQLYRYRWYSNRPATTGYTEQKIRRPGWRGESSIKQRFKLNPRDLKKFVLEGPRSIEEIRQNELANKMFTDVKSWNSDLEPSLRTTYRRTVFQREEGASLRISFDEELKLTNLEKQSYSDCLNPTKQFDPHLVFDFPMSILEVKQAFNDFEEFDTLELPPWIKEMRDSGLIIEVEKFSKYLTGISIMHVDVLHEIPSWLKSVKMFLDIEVARGGKSLMSDSKAISYMRVDENLSDVPLPTRVEPRIFMANERTMLKWVRMSFLGLTVGLALMGFGHEPISGSILSFFGLILLCRAYWIYVKRLRFIKSGDIHGQWTDEISTHILMAMLVIPATIYLCRQVYQVF